MMLVLRRIESKPPFGPRFVLFHESAMDKVYKPVEVSGGAGGWVTVITHEPMAGPSIKSAPVMTGVASLQIYSSKIRRAHFRVET